MDTTNRLHIKSNMQDWCETCSHRFTELKKQALKIMMVEYHRSLMRSTGLQMLKNFLVTGHQQIYVPEHLCSGLKKEQCETCQMKMESLKKEAILSLYHTANFQNKSNLDQQVSSTCGIKSMALSLSEAGNEGSYTNPKEIYSNQVMNMGESHQGATLFETYAQHSKRPGSAGSNPYYHNAPEERKEAHRQSFPTKFSRMLRKTPPPNPPGLFKYFGRRVDGKVKTMLRVHSNAQENSSQGSTWLRLDQRKKQVTVMEPTESLKSSSANPSPAPKIFLFDAIFEPMASQTEVCSSGLLDVLHSVVNGGDGSLLVYGGKGLGKTNTMVGKDDNVKSLGAMPNAISWLYSLIEDSKQRTGARFSVRVSAVEVVGRNEKLNDLLCEQVSADSSASSNCTSPSVYLNEDSLGLSHLPNVSELRATTAEKAAFYLDAALAARSQQTATDDHKADEFQGSHMIFTLHVYQYRVDKNNRGAVHGGRSRLHLIDLCTWPKNAFKDRSAHSAPSHSALGSIIVAMLNGMKCPHRDSIITRLLKDSIGNLACRTTAIFHVSANEERYSEMLSTLQMASKIRRVKRSRNKVGGLRAGLENVPGNGTRQRPPQAAVITSGLEEFPSTGPSDYTSSAAEDSSDTVIYVGPNGHLSDRDLTDNENPPASESQNFDKEDSFAMLRNELRNKSDNYSSSPRFGPRFNSNMKKRLSAATEDSWKVQMAEVIDDCENRVVADSQNLQSTDIMDATVYQTSCNDPLTTTCLLTNDMEEDSERSPPSEHNNCSEARANEYVELSDLREVNLSSSGRCYSQGESDLMEIRYIRINEETEKAILRKEKRIKKLFKKYNSDTSGDEDYTRRSKPSRHSCPGFEFGKSASNDRTGHHERMSSSKGSSTDDNFNINDPNVTSQDSSVTRDSETHNWGSKRKAKKSVCKNIETLTESPLGSKLIVESVSADLKKSMCGNGDTSKDSSRNSRQISENVSTDIAASPCPSNSSREELVNSSESYVTSSLARVKNVSSNGRNSIERSSKIKYTDCPRRIADHIPKESTNENRKDRPTPCSSERYKESIEHGRKSDLKPASDTYPKKSLDDTQLPCQKCKKERLNTSRHDTRRSVRNGDYDSNTFPRRRVKKRQKKKLSRQNGDAVCGVQLDQEDWGSIRPSSVEIPNGDVALPEARVISTFKAKPVRRKNSLFSGFNRSRSRPQPQYVIDSTKADSSLLSILTKSTGSKSRMSSSASHSSGYDSMPTEEGLSGLSGTESGNESKQKKRSLLAFRGHQRGSKPSYIPDCTMAFPERETPEFKVYQIDDPQSTGHEPAQIHIENRTVVKIHRKRVKDLKKQRKALRKELEKIIDNLKLNRKDFEFKGSVKINSDDPAYILELQRQITLLQTYLDDLKTRQGKAACFTKFRLFKRTNSQKAVKE